MKEWLIEKRLKELTKVGKINSQNVRKLFTEYKQDLLRGMAKEDSEARVLLILANSPLIDFILKHKFGIDALAEETDAHSVGKIGLIKAIDSFDIEKGLQFSTYAYHVIYNEILMYFRRLNSVSHTAEKNKISLEECYLEDSRSEIKPQYAEYLKDECDISTEVAMKDLLEKSMRYFVHLTPNEQISLIYCFGLGQASQMTHTQISINLGVSRSVITKCIATGLAKIRLLLQDSSTLDAESKVKYRRLMHTMYPLQSCVREYLMDRDEMMLN